MSSNQRRNKAAIEQYRKELRAMLEDVSEIDKKVLNKAVGGVGIAEAKRLTPVGVYLNEVNFTTKDGKEVRFTTNQTKVGGHMRRSWGVSRTRKSGKSVSKELFNTAEYASYVNYGHRIVSNKKTKGFVKGKFILERAIAKVDKAMVVEFNNAVKEVNKRYDK